MELPQAVTGWWCASWPREILRQFTVGIITSPEYLPLSLCVKLIPCPSFDEGSSKTLVPRSRLVDLRHPFFGDVFSSCSSLVENMLTCITASSWCRIRLVLAPRWVCQGCMALASMGATLKIAVPKHLLMAGCL